MPIAPCHTWRKCRLSPPLASHANGAHSIHHFPSILSPLPIQLLRTSSPSNNNTPNPHTDPRTIHLQHRPSAAAADTCPGPGAAVPADSTCPAADPGDLAGSTGPAVDRTGLAGRRSSRSGREDLGCCSMAVRRRGLGQRRSGRVGVIEDIGEARLGPIVCQYGGSGDAMWYEINWGLG